MRELRLVGLDEDGTHLVLHDDKHDRPWRLAVDDRLHAALRGDRARLGQLEIALDSQLTPREIQARVRAGESVSDVAEAAGVPVDRVMRFAAPVLAEREHVAGRARRAALRRSGDGGPARLLEDAVWAHLAAAGGDRGGEAMEEADVDWDAHRREDGRWVVTVTWYGEGTHRARFAFDVAGHSVVPDDDQARWIAGERPPPSGATSGGPARLSVVPAHRHALHGSDPDEPAGDPLAAAVALTHPPAGTAAGAAPTPGAPAPPSPPEVPGPVGDSGAGVERSGRHEQSGTGDPRQSTGLEEAPTVPVPVPPAARRRRSRGSQSAAGAGTASDMPSGDAAPTGGHDASPEVVAGAGPGGGAEDAGAERLRLSDIARHVEPDDGPAADVGVGDLAEPRAAAAAGGGGGGGGGSAGGRNGRPSVPSWDEIMFGRRRKD